MKLSVTDTFIEAGNVVSEFVTGKNNILTEAINKACEDNTWFNKNGVLKALNSISEYMLTKEVLYTWQLKYSKVKSPKNVLVITAGNIPLVGLHDILCVLMSGNKLILKPASKDRTLTEAFCDILTSINTELKPYIKIVSEIPNEIHAVIATGSNNTARYFESQYKNIPRIIRKNRYSVAILNGTESTEQLDSLGNDIFDYFGLGCRNVSNILLPKNYNFNSMFKAFEKYSYVLQNKNYNDCYRYKKAILEITKAKYITNSFLILQQKQPSFSFVSVLNFYEYESENEAREIVSNNISNIQCVVSQNNTPFGKTQMPQIDDYADGIDTMNFLCEL